MQTRRFTNVIKQALLFRRSSLFRKSISLIAGKTARKVSARSWLVRTSHRDFVTIVELRHAPGRQNKCVGQFKAGYRGAILAHEAPIIMAAEQCHQDF